MRGCERSEGARNLRRVLSGGRVFVWLGDGSECVLKILTVNAGRAELGRGSWLASAWGWWSIHLNSYECHRPQVLNVEAAFEATLEQKID